MCACARTHACKNSPETPVTKPAKLCSCNEMLRANYIHPILENGTSARLKFMLLTGGRADIEFLMCWVSLIQATKVQAHEEVV